MNPWAIAAIGWYYYIVYCSWLVIELIFIIIFIVETRGMFHDFIEEDLCVCVKQMVLLHRTYIGRNSCDIRWRRTATRTCFDRGQSSQDGRAIIQWNDRCVFEGSIMTMMQNCSRVDCSFDNRVLFFYFFTLLGLYVRNKCLCQVQHLLDCNVTIVIDIFWM